MASSSEQFLNFFTKFVIFSKGDATQHQPSTLWHFGIQDTKASDFIATIVLLSLTYIVMIQCSVQTYHYLTGIQLLLLFNETNPLIKY